MISNTLSAPAGACAPDADRVGPAMPENLARLLYIVRLLLDCGRRFPAIIERSAAARDFRLFSAVFATSKLPVILAHIHRGVLRAAALESLLLGRAATGRDVAATPPATHPAPAAHANPHPCDEPFPAQVARLTAERAQYDTSVDPNNLVTAAQIEAEVRARPIGRTIADIRRDLGIVAIMCTNEFWDTMVDAIASYQDGAAAETLDATLPEPEPPPQQAEEDPHPEPINRSPIPYPRPAPGRNSGKPRIALFRPRPASARPRIHVPPLHRHAAVTPAATGPPQRAAALQRAA